MFGTAYEKSKVNQSCGSGLGLTVCKALANQLKGHIHLKSTQGKGTSVYLIIKDLTVLEESNSPPLLTESNCEDSPTIANLIVP